MLRQYGKPMQAGSSKKTRLRSLERCHMQDAQWPPHSKPHLTNATLRKGGIHSLAPDNLHLREYQVDILQDTRLCRCGKMDVELK